MKIIFLKRYFTTFRVRNMYETGIYFYLKMNEFYIYKKMMSLSESKTNINEYESFDVIKSREIIELSLSHMNVIFTIMIICLGLSFTIFIIESFIYRILLKL